MSIVVQSEAERMTEERKGQYCAWCFRKDYGDCDFCALHKGSIKDCNKGKKWLRGEGR